MKLWEVPTIYTHITYIDYNTSQHSDIHQYVVTIV